MTQDYSKSFHDFNNWTISFFSLRTNLPLPLLPQAPEPPRSFR